jgi:hypothetical protein
MDRSEYGATKARANFYGPGGEKPFKETFASLETPISTRPSPQTAQATASCERLLCIA